MHQKAPRKNT